MSDYWERRKAQQMFEYMAGAEERAGSIAKLYLQASRYFAGKMDTIFERYRKQNGLSEADARRLLNQIRTPGDIDELKQLLRQATEEGNSEKRKQLLGELEAPAYRARLERLQRMYGNLDQVMQSIYKQEQIEHEAWYLELASDAYYHSVFDLQGQTGLAYSFGYISPKMIERVINSRWSGANYSERIWGNTQKLAETGITVKPGNGKDRPGSGRGICAALCCGRKLCKTTDPNRILSSMYPDGHAEL